MIYAVLSTKYKVLKTEGNNNNHIGLPFTILRLKDEDIMVIEMGMNNFGEISFLTNIAKPTIAVITNVGTAHIGNLGSRENIMKAKLEIIEGLNGPLIINNDNDILHDNIEYIRSLNKIITIGIDNDSDYMATDIDYDDEGCARYNVINDGNNLEHTLLVYLLPSKIVDNVILNQINIMMDIVNSCISNKNNNVVLKYDLENLVNRFEDSKKIHSFNMFKVGYIYVKGNKRFYINIDNREQDLIFDNIKKAYQNRNIVSYDNTPYTFSANLAYANSNMIGFVIVLIIIVIIVVTILTLGG